MYICIYFIQFSWFSSSYIIRYYYRPKVSDGLFISGNIAVVNRNSDIVKQKGWINLLLEEENEYLP